MSAIGFGQRVTGGGTNPDRIRVTKVGTEGDGTLADAIVKTNHKSEDDRDAELEILIDLDDKDDEGKERKIIAPHARDLKITARNLTIRAVGGAVIDRNHFVFDCKKADNVILRNLRFASDGEKVQTSETNDTIHFDATKGRGPKGFWIDHCEFEAYFDLNITSNTTELEGEPPLLITISRCRFFDLHPSGSEHFNHGAIDFADARKEFGRSQEKNTYATVCNNVFDHVRRRSPRTTGLSVAHAFNNLLLDFGSDNPDDVQQNGMEVGNNGIMVAVANYFRANVLKQSISLAAGNPEPLLTVPDNGRKQNKYANGAMVAHSHGRHIAIGNLYRRALGRDVDIPIPANMSDQLRTSIERNAGPTE
ncbi:MAG: hypothetical protein ACJ8J0_15715 [Longimicrobiaceae bacterium]